MTIMLNFRHDGVRTKISFAFVMAEKDFGETVRKITLDAGLGCPNRDGTISRDGCLYCNPRGSGTGALAQGLSIAEQVDRGINFLSRRYGCRKFIAYFQSFTNTYANRNISRQSIQRR